jgi:hypothetical protein
MSGRAYNDKLKEYTPNTVSGDVVYSEEQVIGHKRWLKMCRAVYGDGAGCCGANHYIECGSDECVDVMARDADKMIELSTARRLGLLHELVVAEMVKKEGEDERQTCMDCIGTSDESSYCNVWKSASQPIVKVEDASKVTACKYMKPRTLAPSLGLVSVERVQTDTTPSYVYVTPTTVMLASRGETVSASEVQALAWEVERLSALRTPPTPSAVRKALAGLQYELDVWADFDVTHRIRADLATITAALRTPPEVLEILRVAEEQVDALNQSCLEYEATIARITDLGFTEAPIEVLEAWERYGRMALHHSELLLTGQERDDRATIDRYLRGGSE